MRRFVGAGAADWSPDSQILVGDRAGNGNGNGAAHGNGNGAAHGNGNGAAHANGNGHGNGNGNANHSHAAPARPVSVSVVVPTLNEAENLPHVLPRIPHWVDEVVLVDGGSDDGTVDVGLALRPDLRVVYESLPGKGVALETGFRASRGDIIITLDADGSTDPAEIPAFVGCLLAGADFAKGSRFSQGGGTSDMGLARRLGNAALRLLVRIKFGGRFSDLCYGYNAFWRSVLPVIEGGGDGFEIETQMNVRALAAGLRVVEVASHEEARIHGESHLRTFRDGFRVLQTILRERRRRHPELAAGTEALGALPAATAPADAAELPRIAGVNGHQQEAEARAGVG